MRQEQVELELTSKQQQICDEILKRAYDNKEEYEKIQAGINLKASQEQAENKKNFEKIKSGIVMDGAESFLKAGIPKPKIGRLLVKTLVSNGEKKKTDISESLIYYVLRQPRFKELKSESHAARARGKGKNQKCASFSTKTSTFPKRPCKEIIEEEIKKIREQNPNLSNRELRQRIAKMDSLKEFSHNTVRKPFAKLLPLDNDDEIPTVATIPAGSTQDVIDREEQEQYLIKLLKSLQDIIEWLSGMTEGQRTQFYKDLPKGKAYSLGLEERCTPRIKFVVERMPTDILGSFRQYIEEIVHLARVWDNTLWEVKQFRESKRDMSSI